MPVVGFNFDKLSVERTGKIEKGIKVRNNIEVKDISIDEISLSQDKKQEVLKLSFEYAVFYDPNVGSTILQGHLLYLDTPAKIKEIHNAWKKDKKIELTLKAQLLNTALIKCNIKALNLSQDVNLPPHLPMPTLNPNVNKAKEYIG